MSSYSGIVAYSNGQYQGTGESCGGWGSTGYYVRMYFVYFSFAAAIRLTIKKLFISLQYQCVELAQRYFNAKYGIQTIWPGKVVYLSLCFVSLPLHINMLSITRCT